MKEFIERNIWVSLMITNNTVDNVSSDEHFNKNHLAKILYEQCNNYKIIIEKLLWEIDVDEKEVLNLEQS